MVIGTKVAYFSIINVGIRARPRSEKHCQQNTALLAATKTNSTCFKSLFSS